MKHVVTSPTPPFVSHSGAFEVHQVPAWQDNLIWLFVHRERKRAYAVDGPEAGGVLEYVKSHGLTLAGIINTHTHPDHIGINQDLDGRGMLDGLRVIGAKARAADIPGLTDPVSDGDTIEVEGIEGRCLLTEGHIDGHISYVFEDVLFCGDTLFGAGCGYLFDGPAEKMHQSLSRLAELPEDTRVCCAHEYTEDNLRFAWTVEPDNEDLKARIRSVWALRKDGRCSVPSTIGDERRTNPFMRHDVDALVQRVQAAWPGRDLSSPADIFAATRALKDRKDYKQLSDTELPL